MQREREEERKGAKKACKGRQGDKAQESILFFFFKEQKKKKNKHTVSTDGKCSPAEGIIRTGDKGSTEIGNNYFVSVFINENEGH